MAPARELVLQIADVIRPVAAGLKTVAFYGGHSMADEVNSMSVVPDIIVSTPGRLLDHIRRGTVDVGGVDALVLDEYDKSLELGFLDEMKRIAKRMRSLKMILLTSATPLAEMPDFIAMQGAEVVDSQARGAQPLADCEGRFAGARQAGHACRPAEVVAQRTCAGVCQPP